ncbi:MAG: lipid-A-disaccharide synthase [Planctomycetota bacterium]
MRRGLIKALQKGREGIEFVGFGGEKMAEAGCELLEKTADKGAMAHKAFGQVWRFFLLIRRMRRYIREKRTDLVIVCDSPAFNFHIAKAAKEAGIKTLFYVAPQLWAWAPWRIEKLKKWCDKLCCILPFEQKWFGERGVEATFVGNPLLDEMGADIGGNKKDYADFDAARAKIALMPGSRAEEIDSLWKPMQQIANGIKRKYPNVTFTAVAVDEERKVALRYSEILGFRCKYEIDSLTEVARRVDFSIVASGSATVQVAAAGCPMVVMYQSSKILWHLLGRWLVKTKKLSLVNILAERELVPEFMPYFDSIEPILQSALQLLEDKNRLRQLSGALVRLVEPLQQENASEKTAQIVRELLGDA